MFTLHWYVIRELLKTFALTAIGLTLLFTMGGGMFNMLRADMLTAVRLAQILYFVVPVALTLTMPVAALFSVTIVYGRLSADNEFNACRSSGINIHRLLAPALLLGAFTAAFTFSFSNYVIPSFVEGIERLVQRNLARTVINALETTGHIEYAKKYVLHADEFHEETAPPSGDDPDKRQKEYVVLRNAAFMFLDQGEPARYGTTPRVRIEFGLVPETGEPRVVAHLENLRVFDQQRKHFYSLGDQQLGPFPFPLEFERRPKWMDLSELLRFRNHTDELPELRKRLPGARDMIVQYLFYQSVHTALLYPPHTYRFGDDRRGYELSAEAVEIGDAASGQPRLIRPVVRQWWDGVRRTYRARSATIKTDRSFEEPAPLVYIGLGPEVTFVDDAAPHKVISKASVDLDAIAVPAEVLTQATAYPDSRLLALDDQSLGLSPRIDDERAGLLRQRLLLTQVIDAEIHSRLAFCGSVLVLVVLGAALGIIFRGGQILTAFVICFLPGIFVTVVIVAGRQVANMYGRESIGLALMWAGIAVVAIADAVVLKRYLRR